MGLSNKTRLIFLGAAVLLLAIAAVWSVEIAENDALADIAERLNAFGYSLKSRDIYVLGESRGTSIAAVLEGTDLAEAVAASRAAGFPSDVAAVGDIIAMLAETEQGVITLYLRDTAIELCFIQTESGEILPLGGI